MNERESFRAKADELRKHIDTLDHSLLTLKATVASPVPRDYGAGSDKGEMIASLTLSHRHLEDARMRIGKALQAMDGGESCYDKPKTNPNERWRVPKVGEQVICAHADWGTDLTVGKTYTVAELRIQHVSVDCDQLQIATGVGGKAYPAFWFESK